MQNDEWSSHILAISEFKGKNPDTECGVFGILTRYNLNSYPIPAFHL